MRQIDARDARGSDASDGRKLVFSSPKLSAFYRDDQSLERVGTRDDVVVQRFRHTDRWCRRDVVGISTTSRRWPLNAPRHHLVLVLRDGRGILLPAPTTSTTSASTNDPAFERKRRWLVEHLVLPNLDATERAASTAAAVLPPPPSLAANPPPPAPPFDPDTWSGPGPLGA